MKITGTKTNPITSETTGTESKECCEKCHDVYYSDDFPIQECHNACIDVQCKCHKTMQIKKKELPKGVCPSCWGKKYNSVMSREAGMGDFPGDKEFDTGSHIENIPCSKCSGTGKFENKNWKDYPETDISVEAMQEKSETMQNERKVDNSEGEEMPSCICTAEKDYTNGLNCPACLPQPPKEQGLENWEKQCEDIYHTGDLKDWKQFISKTLQEAIATERKRIVEEIEKDLEDGKFYSICSNETTFKNYIINLIKSPLIGENKD